MADVYIIYNIIVSSIACSPHTQTRIHYTTLLVKIRISFNLAFKDNGINEEWSEERYGKLLEVGGGKERMTAHWVSDK